MFEQSALDGFLNYGTHPSNQVEFIEDEAYFGKELEKIFRGSAGGGEDGDEELGL